MDLLKKVFPFAFTAKKDVVSLVITIIIYLVRFRAGFCNRFAGRYSCCRRSGRLLAGSDGSVHSDHHRPCYS